MNFLLTQQVWNAFWCIRFSKTFHLGYPVCPKTIFFGYSVSPQFIFHAFGLSRVYFKWLVMAWIKLFTNVELVQLIFNELVVIKMNFILTRHVWNAFLCIRFAKTFSSGYPVYPETIFLYIRFVRSSFFMRSVCPKSIFNSSLGYEVDYLQMWSWYGSFLTNWLSSKWII